MCAFFGVEIKGPFSTSDPVVVLPDLGLGSATPCIGLVLVSCIPARSHIPSTEFSPLLVYHRTLFLSSIVLFHFLAS